MDYLSSSYYVPPSGIFEYDSYSYEHEPIPKSYQFMEEEEGDDGACSPRNVEYLTFVQSIAPDLAALRAKTKRTVETRWVL